MELFTTDRDRPAFPLETDLSACDAQAGAALDLDFEVLEAQAEAATVEPRPENRPKYITNSIGWKQKLDDWIWKHTSEGVESAVEAFSGSAGVVSMDKTKGLRVPANERLHHCHHAARAIIENDKARLCDEDLSGCSNRGLCLPPGFRTDFFKIFRKNDFTLELSRQRFSTTRRLPRCVCVSEG